jgi:hypothetical protein
MKIQSVRSAYRSITRTSLSQIAQTKVARVRETRNRTGYCPSRTHRQASFDCLSDSPSETRINLRLYIVFFRYRGIYFIHPHFLCALAHIGHAYLCPRAYV